MSIEKNIIFLFPISSVVQQLKEKLEENDQFIIYEMDSLAEYTQIAGILEYFVTFSSDLRKTSRYLQENKSFVRKNGSRNIVVTNKEISPLAMSKLQKFGLNELLADNISLRSLEYKIDMFFRPFEQKAKRLEEEKQAASQEMAVLSLNSKTPDDTGQKKLHIERMGLIDDNKNADPNDYQNYDTSGLDDLDSKPKSPTMSGLLSSPFDQSHLKAKGFREAQKQPPNFKRANFTEVPRELKQKNSKLDLPDVPAKRKKRGTFEEVTRESNLKKSPFQEVAQEIDPNEYGMDLEEEHSDKSFKSTSVESDPSNKKKHSKFEEVDKKSERKKSSFEEVERENSRKNTSFEEVKRENTRKGGNFEEVTPEANTKKGSFEEVEREQNRKNKFQEVERESSNKKGTFQEVKKEHNRKKGLFEEAPVKKPKWGKFEEFKKENEKKTAQIEEIGKEVDFSPRETDDLIEPKKQKGLEFNQNKNKTNKKFQELKKETNDKSFAEEKRDNELNYKGRDLSQYNNLVYRPGTEFEKNTKKKKYGKFDTFKPVTKKRTGFIDLDKKHQKDTDVDVNKQSKRNEFEKWQQDEKEYYEKSIDYNDLDNKKKKKGKFRPRGWGQLDTEDVIDELLAEPEYKFFEPNSYSLEYMILIQEFYQRPQVTSKEIFKLISFGLLKSLNAAMSVFIFDETNIGNEVFCGHTVFGLFDEAQWNALLDENLDQWESLSLPTWKDETFQLEVNEFLYPLFEDQKQIGFVVAHFKNSISTHTDAEIAEMLLMTTKGVSYSLYPYGVAK